MALPRALKEKQKEGERRGQEGKRAREQEGKKARGQEGNRARERRCQDEKM